APTTTNVMSLWLSDHFNKPVTHLVNRCNWFSNQRINRPKICLSDTRSNLPKREVSNGTIVNEATKLSSVAITTTTQNSRKISDTIPVLMAMGKNTTTMTNVMDTTVNPISFAPS